jgi:hypothetical protein
MGGDTKMLGGYSRGGNWFCHFVWRLLGGIQLGDDFLG